jgi:hypothetical protein
MHNLFFSRNLLLISKTYYTYIFNQSISTNYLQKISGKLHITVGISCAAVPGGRDHLTEQVYQQSEKAAMVRAPKALSAPAGVSQQLSQPTTCL